MRRLLSLSSGLVLLLALTGCAHHYSGVCDCDWGIGCDYGLCPVGASGHHAPAMVVAPAAPVPAATIIRPEPIKEPVKIETKEPEKSATPVKPSL